MSSLFRPEALANKSNNLFGKAYLSIPMSYSIYTLVLFVITVMILIGVYYGNYARKETVKGVLVPTKGLIRIVASRHGQVSQLPITTDAQVKKEDTLLRLTSLTHLTTGESVLNQQAELLQNQIKALIKQEKIEKKLFIANKQKQQEAIKEYKSKIWQISKQLNVSAELVTLKNNQYKKAIKLETKGYLTEAEKNNSYQNLLVQQQQHEDSKRRLMNEKSTLHQLEHELNKLPLLLNQRMADLQRQQSNFKNQLVQLNAQKAEQLLAPVNGEISTLLVHLGEQVRSGQLLLTLVPEGSLLEAELYLPNRAAGFIHTGQQVRLRYQAFSYQRYGIFSGKVTQISKTILTPSDFSASIPLTEAVYKVKVELAQQSINAFGNEHKLQAGMQLEADIVLDTMSLFDWFMMPIHAIKGKW